MSDIQKNCDLKYDENIYLDNNIELLIYVYTYFTLYTNEKVHVGDTKEIVISASVNSECITFFAEKVKMSVEKDCDLPFPEEVLHLDFTPLGGGKYPVRCTINEQMYSESLYIRFSGNDYSIIPTMSICCYDELVLQVSPTTIDLPVIK